MSISAAGAAPTDGSQNNKLVAWRQNAVPKTQWLSSSGSALKKKKNGQTGLCGVSANKHFNATARLVQTTAKTTTSLLGKPNGQPENTITLIDKHCTHKGSKHVNRLVRNHRRCPCCRCQGSR